jgi:hypothetical protein
MKSAFREQMEKMRERNAIFLKEELGKYRFLYDTHNAVRLKRALASQGLYHLQDKTLLSPEIHDLHAKGLAKRLLKKGASVQRSIQKQREKIVKINKRFGAILDPIPLTTHDQFRFLTVLHDVEVLNVEATLRMVRAFKEQLQSIIEGCQGVWCLGTVEVEVISMHHMRQLKETSESEERKIGVCESMVSRQGMFRDENVYFLIHFHGMVVTKKDRDCTAFERQLKAQWNQEPRQVQMKPLSKVFRGQVKTVEKSLEDIARYITKGGNDWVKGTAYLRYKTGFDNEHLNSEEAWVNRNRRRNKTLRLEHMEHGLEDALAMTHSEIGLLAQVIDGMMSMDDTRTGYLVAAQSKAQNRKLSTTG